MSVSHDLELIREQWQCWIPGQKPKKTEVDVIEHKGLQGDCRTPRDTILWVENYNRIAETPRRSWVRLFGKVSHLKEARRSQEKSTHRPAKMNAQKRTEKALSLFLR